MGTAIAIPTAIGNAALTIAEVMAKGVSTKILPAIHKAASAIKGIPLGVGWPVQVCTAVSRKPAMIAVVYPNSIS